MKLHCFVLLFLALVVAISALDISPRYRYETRSRKRISIVTRCYYRRTCYGPRRYCGRKCVYYTEYYSVRVCAPGYTGTFCNIPVCKSPCRNGGFCIRPNVCECPTGTSGSNCARLTCAEYPDCYPGVCDNVDQCNCASAFNGTNCQTMKDGPQFVNCKVFLVKNRTINAEEKILENANCSLNDENALEIYTNQGHFDVIRIELEQTYTDHDRPTYNFPDTPVKKFELGILDSGADMLLRDSSGTGSLPANIQCYSGSARPLVYCQKDEVTLGRLGIDHGQQLDIELFGETGGLKDILYRDQDSNRLFAISGVRDSRIVKFKFDTEPPVHCSEVNRCNYTAGEIDFNAPCITLQDRTQDPQVTVQFFGWLDDDSELFGYSYKVYQMSLNGDGELQENRRPVVSRKYDEFSAVDFYSTFSLEPHGHGMYSIIGDVEDFAGNIRHTRGLVLYHPNDTRVERYNKTMKVTPSVNYEDGAFWLSNLTQGLFFNWTGCYGNLFLDTNKLMSPIRALNSSVTPPVNFVLPVDYRGGNISVAGSANDGGVVNFRYKFAYSVQVRENTRVKRQAPTDWVDLGAGTSLSQGVTGDELRNGLTMYLEVTDGLDMQLTDDIIIRGDDTPPVVSNTPPVEFRANVERPDVYGFYSSVNMVVQDDESGISRIDSQLYDTRAANMHRFIGKASQPGQRVSRPCTSCVCTIENECYRRPQVVYIDNCWFRDYMTVPTLYTATVYNRALLSTSVNTTIPAVSSLRGINEYPPVIDFRVKRPYIYSVIVTWYAPVACYAVDHYEIEVEGANNLPSLSGDSEEVAIEDLDPGKSYTATIYVVYETSDRSEGFEIILTTAKGEPSGLSGGAIAGIVIGILLLIGIIVIIILILLRKKQKKPALPSRVRSFTHTVRTRFSKRFGGDASGGNELPTYKDAMKKGNRKTDMVLNLAYAKKGPKLRDFEEDIYAYGDMTTDPEAKWKHSTDEVMIGKVIATGRFAEIRVGTMRDEDGTRKVAVKMLRDHNSDNILLMKAKMNFMATAVPTHNNIVNFIGAVTEGPILLLEHCDQSLKDWLRNIEKITDEVEDNMINFCTDTARGMQHLHDNEIIHRRLGARNVLIRHIPHMARFVAKVTGFGPMKGEQSGEGIDGDKERIPIKWMAPEQLGLGKKKRPYNDKTDVWSFGITVWEIFSKGGSPFKDYNNAEIKSAMTQGIRPECPEYSSDEVYNEVMTPSWLLDPKKRPSFSNLKDTLERLFHGAPNGDDYYGDDTYGEDFNMDMGPRHSPDLYDRTEPPRY